jgi:hypothetical protein
MLHNSVVHKNTKIIHDFWVNVCPAPGSISQYTFLCRKTHLNLILVKLQCIEFRHLTFSKIFGKHITGINHVP